LLKRYTFWLWLAVVFLFLTGAVHSVALFITPQPGNEVERQMIELMTTHKQDMGAGFHPTMWNLLTALSSCFSFLSFITALTLAYLLKKKVDPGILKGIVRIDLLVFAGCFIVMAIFTFLLPIVMTGLCVLFLAVGLLLSPASKATDSHG
jgi:hypothetical protein